ncbi:sugar phosphate isomerase/epimerase family protein [Cohnella fermenti]|uniref:Sugar phosphate isomerase/epimerase n=1 Tax=Cohnella fermenti TaxID=2565925 RepID=A0A4S4C062_9BACL|nr:sugar phosphate isomerase/epimerase [Cohnella fermenti]THF80302.1 sugar phosphate isomerase/epimerase [Cohnella fermenti]
MSRPHYRLGINHHLLYPASLDSASAHGDSLAEALALPGFEVTDCYVPSSGEEAQTRAIARIAASGREPIYNCPLMLGPDWGPHHPDVVVRERTRDEAKRHIDRAKSIGARKMVVASGDDPGPERREEEMALMIAYMIDLCAYAGAGLCLMIEPFDRSIGRNLLIGPTVEAVAVVEAVRSAGCENIGLLVDMGHIPLMGESFRHAVATAGRHIRHVHLGSCVMRDSRDPLYGDMHPPWGYPGGENDVAEAAEFLRCLIDAGYFEVEGEESPTLTLEMRPYPGMTERSSAELFIRKLEQAWQEAERL